MSDNNLVPMAVYAGNQSAASESTTCGWVRGYTRAHSNTPLQPKALEA